MARKLDQIMTKLMHPQGNYVRDRLATRPSKLSSAASKLSSAKQVAWQKLSCNKMEAHLNYPCSLLTAQTVELNTQTKAILSMNRDSVI